jgi:hypothetical protein
MIIHLNERLLVCTARAVYSDARNSFSGRRR